MRRGTSGAPSRAIILDPRLAIGLALVAASVAGMWGIVAAIDDTVEGLTEDLSEAFLKPYFSALGQPLREGDTFTVRSGSRTVDFRVRSRFTRATVMSIKLQD